MLNQESSFKKIVKIKQNYICFAEPATDKEGHYDLDGVSISPSVGVVVAGTDQPIINNQSIDEAHSSLQQKSLQEVQVEADNISVKLKTQNTPSEDGIIDKSERLSSAKPTPGMDPYLEFEKAGD